MELKWLEDFLAVAELRNFSKAAVARNTTQPALSRRVRALEAWYGVALFDRSSYPVELTPTGSTLLPSAQHMVSELYRCRRQARADVGIAARSLSFAMPQSLAVHFFPSWWREQKRPSETKATVVAADLDDCVDLLLSGACQYLLCYQHDTVRNGLDEQGLQRARVGLDRLLPVCAARADGQPLFDFIPAASGVTPLLVYGKGSFLGRVTGDLFPRLQARCALSLRYESALVEALKAEALLGEGIAWLPERMIERELADGRLCALGGSEFEVPLEVWLFCPPASTPCHGLHDLFAT